MTVKAQWSSDRSPIVSVSPLLFNAIDQSSAENFNDSAAPRLAAPNASPPTSIEHSKLCSIL